jgi:hypothetical protein
MKRFLMAVMVFFAMGGKVRGDDGPPVARGALGSGASLGHLLPAFGKPSVAAEAPEAPLTRGLGQVVSAWTHEGIHGEELAERIHWLQPLRADDMSRPSWSERQPGRERDGFYRDRNTGQTRHQAVDNHGFREGNGFGRDREFSGARGSRSGVVSSDTNNVMKQDSPPTPTPSLWSRFRSRIRGD